MFRKNIKIDLDLPLRPPRLCGEKSGFSRGARNSGVALVMVLGLLTVMVLMAVTFAISMRTERLAAGNAADNVRARELVHVGLARALNNMVVAAQYGLGTNGLSSSGSPSPQVYPFWPAMVSGNGTYTNTSANVYLLYATNGSTRANEATNYVPRALWSIATNTDEIGASSCWEVVDSIITNGNGVIESNRMGRVKYLILNCSGLLDANYAGGAARMGGMSPAEIAIGNMGEIGSSAAATDFHNRRLIDVRYETMADLNAAGNLAHPPSTNLFVYFRALPGYWNTNFPPCLGTQVNLSGTEADMPAGSDRWRAITNAFYLAGFSGSEAGVLYRNLIDYIDLGSKPELLTTSVESVPMINEVVVSNYVDVATVGAGPNKNYTGRTEVYVESWYPFVTNAGASFDLQIDVTHDPISGFTPSPDSFSDILGTPLAGSFNVIKHSIPINILNVAPVASFIFVSKITLSVKLGADIVDQVVSISITNINDGTIDRSYRTLESMECLDPRFNDNAADTNQWRYAGAAPTLYGYGGSTGTNTWTTWYFSTYTTNCDNEGNMYVANRALKSVAELGCLVYAPWKTVKLYGPNCHRVLDVFGLSTNTSDIYMTNIVYRGRVNCNSNSVLDATAAVFAGMPVDQYPGEASALLPLDMDQARSVAASIFNGGTYTNLSNVGRYITFPVGTTELQKESYFRNAFNLLNLRQNVFTIIIEAQAASGGNIPRNPARQRAVAIVWRDPYTGEMFVRHIKWLGD